MNRRPRPTRSNQQIKEEQINFLLKDVEKNLEEYKKAIESRDKQLSDIKKILQGAKKSYDSVIKENTELKQYIENIKQRYQQYQKQQQQEYFDREREYFRQKQPKKHKRVVYEEESDSEPEVDESEYVPEETEEETEKFKIGKKQTPPKRKNYVFEYLNNDVKRNREITDKIFLGNTISSFNEVGRSSAIDRTASNYNGAREKGTYQYRTI